MPNKDFCAICGDDITDEEVCMCNNCGDICCCVCYNASMELCDRCSAEEEELYAQRHGSPFGDIHGAPDGG